MTESKLRKRKEAATSCATQQTDESIDTVVVDDDEKIHASPFYVIYNANRMCQVFMSLAMVIFAVTWAQVTFSPVVVSAQISHSDTQEVGVRDDGQVEAIIRRSPRAPVYNGVLHIAYLQDEKDRFSFHYPQPMQNYTNEDEGYYDGEQYYDKVYYTLDSAPALDIDGSFNEVYRTAPDLNKDSDIEVYEEVDMAGHLYTDEDYQDDFLAVMQDPSPPDGLGYLFEYFSFDDDVNRSPQVNEDGSLTSKCRATSWSSQHNPTCNKLHEVPILNEDEYYGYYLASGAYRDAFSVLNTEAVLKVGVMSRPYNTELLDMIRFDAVTMDILTPSERIVNIYGHCGVSVQVEPITGPSIEDLTVHSERRGIEDILPPILSPAEKLKTALGMAEALSDLHGYAGGVIVHYDIQIGQYLLDADYSVKMSDFNRAESQLWNEEDQEYCDSWLGHANGMLRSPEEYNEIVPVGHSADVYSYGNILFTLLTGKWPYGSDSDKGRILCGQGIPPIVDYSVRGESFASASLAAIMDKCFEFYPERRIDIFMVVSMLKDAIKLNNEFESVKVTKFEEVEHEVEDEVGVENEDEVVVEDEVEDEVEDDDDEVGDEVDHEDEVKDEDEVDQEVEVHNEKNIVRKEDDGEDYYYYQKYYHPAERRFDE